MIYLASPYSHANPDIKLKRVEEVAKLAAKLMEDGHHIFCPITHTVPIEQFVKPENNTHNFWLTQDFKVLKLCNTLYVAMLDPEWTKSFGVAAEIAFARANNMKIVYLTADGIVDHVEDNEYDFNG